MSADASTGWSEQQHVEADAKFLAAVGTEDSPYRLGQVLAEDVHLDLPFTWVKATYERLFAIGVDDVRTRLCYARYLLLHGPTWDEVAQSILAQVEPAARGAGLWEAPQLGHHPVFFADLG